MAESLPPQNDFQKWLEDKGASKDTIQTLERDGCTNWATFDCLSEGDIDSLDIKRLQKPLLWKLLRERGERGGGSSRSSSSSSQSDSSGETTSQRVVVTAADIVGSDICGLRRDAGVPSQPVEVTVTVNRSRNSRVTGCHYGPGVSHYGGGAGTRQKQTHANPAYPPPPYSLRDRGQSGQARGSGGRGSGGRGAGERGEAAEEEDRPEQQGRGRQTPPL